MTLIIKSTVKQMGFSVGSAIGLCQVTSHSRESKCILGIAGICKVSKPRFSVVGELSFSFSSKWYD